MVVLVAAGPVAPRSWIGRTPLEACPLDYRVTPRRAYASKVTLPRALVCLLALSCAHEQAARSPESGSPAHAPAAPLPFPDSAFRDDAAPSAPASAPAITPHSPYETRRIGATPPPAARYRGAPVDLDLKGAELANVFRLLSDVGHVNIVVSGDVTGTITLRLKHVPWDQALEVVARARDLDLEYDGNVIVVRTAGKH